METYISNMLFYYRLNLKNLYITQFADLLQRTMRILLTIKTMRVPISQAMITSVGEKRKKPKGKVADEPPMILCTGKN